MYESRLDWELSKIEIFFSLLQVKKYTLSPMEDIESQEQTSLTNKKNGLNKECCVRSGDLQFLCVFPVLLILLLCLMVFTYIYNFISEEHREGEIDYYKKNMVVKSGYWNDQKTMCSVESPCYMNCIEYNRFDIGCEKSNRDCILGRYDYCRDEPTGQWMSDGEKYREIFHKMYPE